jgi:hypothetical protein
MAARALELDIAYLGELVGAGWDGIAAARNRTSTRVFTSPLDAVAPTAIGAAIGALSTRLLQRRKSGFTVAMGGLVGSIVGCGAALAWSSRGIVVPAARGAAQRVNAVRDAHWLQANPITYA